MLGIGSDHIKSGLVLIYHENSILRSCSKRFAMQSNRLSVSNPTFDVSGEAYVVGDSRDRRIAKIELKVVRLVKSQNRRINDIDRLSQHVREDLWKHFHARMRPDASLTAKSMTVCTLTHEPLSSSSIRNLFIPP